MSALLLLLLLLLLPLLPLALLWRLAAVPAQRAHAYQHIQT